MESVARESVAEVGSVAEDGFGVTRASIWLPASRKQRRSVTDGVEHLAEERRGGMEDQVEKKR